MSFLNDYLKTTEGNESPYAYHLWSCMAALSSAAGRRFWFSLGHLRFYPNLYVLLVGEPGVKKTSAMNTARDMIQLAGVCPVGATQASKEYITKAMSHEKFPGKKYFLNGQTQEEYNQYSIFATEFTQFIAINPEGMLDFLTTVYDAKVYACDTKGQGSDYIQGPYITMLGCLTPHMLKGFLKMNVLTGGFARRTVFVYGREENIVPIPTFTQEQKEAAIRCVEWIKKIAHSHGEFTFGPGAQEWYENWYTNLRKNIKEIATPATEGYYRSKHELLFKTAMLLVLGTTPIGAPLEILPGHFEFLEKRFFKAVDENLERVFEGTGINPNANAITQVCHMLEAMDRPMNKKQLLVMFMNNVTSMREFEDSIHHLVVAGRLAEATVCVNGALAGTVIATPECLKRFSNEDLAAFLKPVGSLHASPTADQNSSERQQSMLDELNIATAGL